MNTVYPAKEPITPQVLWRYKGLIAIIAVLVILAGYVRIITQNRTYTSTATLQVRYSGDALNLAEGPVGRAMKVPLLEEEVKAHILHLSDPQFIDQVIQDLQANSGPSNSSDPLPEEVEQTAMEKLRETIADTFASGKQAVSDFFDRILFVEDTVVSDRERQVFSVLGGLAVTAGENASHLITVSYRGRDPVYSARIANGIARKFIEVQKEKTKPKDLDALQESVDRARRSLVEITAQKYQALSEIGSPTLDDAIRKSDEERKSLTAEKWMLKDLILLNEQGHGDVSYTDSRVRTRAESSGRDWIIDNEIARLMAEAAVASEKQGRVEKQIEILEALRRAEKSKTLQSVKVALEQRLQSVDRRLLEISKDTTFADWAPRVHELQAQEMAAQAELNRFDQELIEGKKFNEILADKQKAEHVALWQAANVPPFPDQQRRFLKFMVILVLGCFAGCAAAVGRHLFWPKFGPQGPVMAPTTYAPAGIPAQVPAGAVAGNLDVPIVVLPEDAEDDELEDGIQFDMTYPEDEKPRG